MSPNVRRRKCELTAKMSLLRDLLEKVNSASVGSAELDKDVVAAFPTASSEITKSIDSVVHLIETELPGWWWACGFCTLSNDASIEVPRARTGPDFRAGPEPMQLLIPILTLSNPWLPSRGVRWT
jgi:hypothetical protein